MDGSDGCVEEGCLCPAFDQPLTSNWPLTCTHADNALAPGVGLEPTT